MTFIFSGCDSIGKVKSENPVLGPPPPRMHTSKEEKTNPETLASTSEIQLVSREESSDSFRGNHVIAIVNGEPIFASEIMDMLSGKLSQIQSLVDQGKIPEEQFIKWRKDACKNFLPSAIKRHVLLTEMKKTLTEEQLEQLNTQLDEGFKNHIIGLQEKNNVQTRYELEQILAKENVNLVDLKYLITNVELAKYYEHSERKEPKKITRADLMKEYNNRKEGYKIEGTVKWQQISINYEQPNGKAEALQIVEEIVKKLGQNSSFEDLAREYSDGPTARNGGNWDWMQPTSLAETVIVDSLKTLPEGKISQVLEGEKQFHLIRVLKRIETHTKSFEEVQVEIKRDLERARAEESLAQVYEELKSRAVIQTVFDNEEEQKQMETKRDLPTPFK